LLNPPPPPLGTACAAGIALPAMITTVSAVSPEILIMDASTSNPGQSDAIEMNSI
jgi:hypothetical protein